MHDHQPHRRLVRRCRRCRSGPICTCVNMPRVDRSACQPPQDLRPRLLRPVLQPVGVVLGHPSARRRRSSTSTAPPPSTGTSPDPTAVTARSRSSRSCRPGVAMPSQMCCRSIPLCAAFSVGRGAEEDRPGKPPGDPAAARSAGRDASIKAGAWTGAVDVGVDHRLEAVLQVLRDLRQHVVGVKRHPARHDQRRRVVALPQLVDDRGHQPQHATGPLEPVQRRPVAVQPVEQLRVQRVRRLDPLLIRRLGDPGRELGPVTAHRSR